MLTVCQWQATTCFVWDIFVQTLWLLSCFQAFPLLEFSAIDIELLTHSWMIYVPNLEAVAEKKTVFVLFVGFLQRKLVQRWQNEGLSKRWRKRRSNALFSNWWCWCVVLPVSHSAAIWFQMKAGCSPFLAHFAPPPPFCPSSVKHSNLRDTGLSWQIHSGQEPLRVSYI